MTKAGAERRAGDGMKVCPRCGSRLFEDMNVCYACLYDFSKDRTARVPGMPELDAFGFGEVEDRDLPSEVNAVPEPCSHPTPTRLPRAAMYEDPPFGEDLAGPAVEWDGGYMPDESLPSDSPDPLASDDCMAPSFSWGRHAWTREMGVRVVTGDADVTCHIPADGLTVGRSGECDVMLHDGSVNRFELLIRRDEDCVVVSPLDAGGMATLWGEPLLETQMLGAGEPIDVCGTRLMLVPLL
ncbi:MAG: FHA domain-containing protein [Atopobiaceae bacterium]|nr:FHA domain-containing protein [Atopobiaceae bacterium]MCI2174232.1 FHA domain-containing protein [Atopobiaceae bacterium]MCI2206873.1 FHA domain-containing protein [Atopobiaceae bacterium]